MPGQVDNIPNQYQPTLLGDDFILLLLNSPVLTDLMLISPMTRTLKLKHFTFNVLNLNDGLVLDHV